MERDRIEEAKRNTVYDLLGLSKGRRQAIKCPFHNDGTPSCMIYPSGSFHCFGCGAHGNDSIAFVMQLGMTFPKAIDYLTNTI